MPGWHEATAELQRQGKLQMVGVIQEQHPERCRLFMQWKEMDWPILVDSLNLLQVPLVPITLAIDEHGVIRHTRLSLRDARRIEEIFLDREYPPPTGTTSQTMSAMKDLEALRLAADAGQAPALRELADALALKPPAGEAPLLTEAIAAYHRASELDPGDGWSEFRLGVSYRRRWDSAAARPGDFQRAVDHWSRALEIDPNNYIWRRRIQQYGPRLKKPYPFYDWVPLARQEIVARGQEPVLLPVEPGPGEYARPERSFRAREAGLKEPDPRGRIHRDSGRLIEVQSTVVPGVVAAGEAVRVHLQLVPRTATRAHWNNEVDELEVWIDPPRGWQVESRRLTLPNPRTAVSQELRSLEFELKSPDDGSKGPTAVPGYALYYVCEDTNGTCLYRRQDLEVEVVVAGEKG